MGGLIKFLPFTYSVMLVGTLSLLATPFLTAFYSKDLIIELAFAQYSFSGTYAFILGTVTAGLTAFYSVRLLCLVFFTVPNGPKISYINSHEAKLAVIIPFFILALFSIFFGFLISDMFAGAGSAFFGNSIFIHPNNISLIEAEFSISPIVKLLPLFCTIFGALSAFLIYNFYPNLLVDITDTSIGRKIYSILNSKYYFDVIYNNYVIKTGLQLGYNVSKLLDRGIIELVGPYGLANMFSNIGIKISKLDTGIVTTYGLYIIISILFLIYVIYGSTLSFFYVIDFRLLIVLIFSLGIVLISDNKNNLTPLPFSNLVIQNPNSSVGKFGVGLKF
jgi:NADH-ubiquinone oxidoreductase chain 5